MIKTKSAFVYRRRQVRILNPIFSNVRHANLREDKAVPGNHVTILRMKPDAGLDPVFLSSGQIELYPSDIKEFRIWLASPKIQQQIKSDLEQAHAARQEAQDLLAKAKRAVEVAIEEGEEKAMQLLPQ